MTKIGASSFKIALTLVQMHFIWFDVKEESERRSFDVMPHGKVKAIGSKAMAYERCDAEGSYAMSP